ncbi:MAG: NUDIX hydrolase [Deltaproteobacteria bacterium]|nr:NUDIX hydrolase [Deltaproteobacteria bacterium]
MRRLAVELERPFSRAQPQAHFTGSAVVVDPSGKRVCLVHHARLGRWLQPGGHVDAVDGGSMQATALREAREETGCRIEPHPSAVGSIDVDVHAIPARPDEPAHEHLDVRFLAVALDPEALRHDPGESLGARWIAWDEALAVATDRSLLRLLRKARHPTTHILRNFR